MFIYKLEIEPDGWAIPSAFEFYFTDIPARVEIIYQIRKREKYAGKAFCATCIDAIIEFGIPQLVEEGIVSNIYWWSKTKEYHTGITRITKIDVIDL